MDGRVLVGKDFQEKVAFEWTGVSKGKQLNYVTPGGRWPSSERWDSDTVQPAIH